jgi:putative selenium metabolism hydrolase
MQEVWALPDSRKLADLARGCLNRAAELEEHVVGLLREFIAIPSLSGSEKGVADRVLTECRLLGLEARRDRTGTVLAAYGDGPLNVVYDAHMDTVGPGDAAAWEHGSYSGDVSGRLVFGRGASDNKGALAAMLCGIKIAQDLDLGQGVALTLAAVVEEEVCEGWAIGEAIRNQGLQPDLVVLGECTAMGLARGHRGRCEFGIATNGLSCHGSSPWRGRNAIYDMAEWSLRIRDAASELPASRFLGPASIAVTGIAASGGSPNVIPDRCSALVDRRTIPGERAREIGGALLAMAPEGCRPEVRLVEYDLPSYTGHRKRVPKEFPAWELDAGSPLLRGCAQAVKLVAGTDPAIGRWEFSTDGVMTCGTLGIPTIGFGPGEERWAHTTSDQVPIDHLVSAAAVYALLPRALAWTLKSDL